MTDHDRGQAIDRVRERYVYDDDLDDEQRARLARYTTPRVALDGRLVWPVDEVDDDAD